MRALTAKELELVAGGYDSSISDWQDYYGQNGDFNYNIGLDNSGDSSISISGDGYSWNFISGSDGCFTASDSFGGYEVGYSGLAPTLHDYLYQQALAATGAAGISVVTLDEPGAAFFAIGATVLFAAGAIAEQSGH